MLEKGEDVLIYFVFWLYRQGIVKFLCNIYALLLIIDF